MKKLIMLLIGLVMVFGLAGCGSEAPKEVREANVVNTREIKCRTEEAIKLIGYVYAKDNKWVVENYKDFRDKVALKWEVVKDEDIPEESIERVTHNKKGVYSKIYQVTDDVKKMDTVKYIKTYVFVKEGRNGEDITGIDVVYTWSDGSSSWETIEQAVDRSLKVLVNRVARDNRSKRK